MWTINFEGIDETGACQGDSGGPLLVFETTDERFIQIGIVSGSIQCTKFPGKLDQWISTLEALRST